MVVNETEITNKNNYKYIWKLLSFIMSSNELQVR